MTVNLTNDVQWINECYVHEDETHEHVAVYLLQEGDNFTVVDSGSFYHRSAIMDDIAEATNRAGLGAIVLSHSDYPHSANIGTFRDEWGDVDLVASSGAPSQQGLPEARKATIGESMDVKGRTFSFIDPPLADRSHTTWIFDHGDDVLFTADGFGNVHEPGDCDMTSRELAGGIDYDDVLRHNRETLVWLRYVNPEKLRNALESILDEYDPTWVAPIHGNPIHRDELDDYLEKLLRAAERLADEYEVPEN